MLRKSRRDGRARILPILALVCAAALLGAPGVADGKRPGTPRIASLHVPATVAAGSSLVVRGKLRRSAAGAEVRLEQRIRRRWRARAGVRVKGSARRFVLRWRAPARPGALVLRVSVRRRGARGSASRPRRVRILLVASPAPQPAAGTGPHGGPAPQGPASTAPGSTGPSELAVRALRLDLVAGTMASPAGLAPIETVSELSALSAPAGVTARLVDGVPAIAAAASAPPGDGDAKLRGTGCTATGCGRTFSLTVPVRVRQLAGAAGKLESFSEPSPDRIAKASDHDLTDELLVAVGTAEQLGTRAQADAAAAAAGGLVTGGLEAAGIYEVRWASTQDLAARRSQLAGRPDVIAVSESTVGLYGTEGDVPVAAGFDLARWTWP